LKDEQPPTTKLRIKATKPGSLGEKRLEAVVVIISQELYKRLAHERTGAFETNAVTDGVRRLIVYSQIGDFPLVVGVGRSTADIFADWRRYAPPPRGVDANKTAPPRARARSGRTARG
jgi:hypothetical protein